MSCVAYLVEEPVFDPRTNQRVATMRFCTPDRGKAYGEAAKREGRTVREVTLDELKPRERAAIERAEKEKIGG